MYRRPLYRRALRAAALVTILASVSARADESIAGQWDADLGKGKLISMTILADGYWLSENVQNGQKVGQMAGSYEQKKVNDTTGTLVFTPDAAKTHVSEAHGAARVETDKYTLAQGGQLLRLTPGSGGVMEFHKQSQ